MPQISYAQRIADHAAADPDHLAVTDQQRTVTRAELEALANRTAGRFRPRVSWPATASTIALAELRRVRGDR